LLLSLQVHPEYGGKKCIDTDSPDEKSESYPHDILNIHIFDQITQIQISEEPVEKFREYLIRHNQKRHDHDQKKRCGRNSRCCSLRVPSAFLLLPYVRGIPSELNLERLPC